MSALVPLTVAVPMLAAVLLALVGLWLPRTVCDLVALAASVATVVLCALLLVHTGSGLELHWFGGWHPRGSIAIGVDFAVDAFGAGLATFVAVLMTLGLVYDWSPEGEDHPQFHVLMLVFLAAMVGFCETGDLFDLFVFFELMSVSAFALVGYKSEDRPTLEGALNFAVSNTVGSLLFLVGLALVYGRTGALNLAQIGQSLAHHPPDPLVLVAFALLLAGFFVKAAIVPFHFWLADAYAVAPASVCLLLAGAMSEMGLFGVGRVYFTAFHEALAAQHGLVQGTLVTLGLLTALLGAVMALAQDHLKRMLAYVTISYVGVFLVGLGLLSADGAAGAAIYVVADGLAKAGLFACVGIVEHRRGHVRQSRLHGRARDLRWTGAVFLVLAIMTSGLPPFGAFLAKSVLDDAALSAGFGFVPAVLVVVVALNAGALLRAFARVFLGVGEPAVAPSRRAAEARVRERHARTPATMFVPALLLALGAAGAGAWFGVADLATHGAERFVDQAGYARAVLAGGATRVVSPGSDAPAWFDYLYGLAACAGAVGVAALGLWPGRLRTTLAGAGRVLSPLVRAHSGHVGDYIAWLTVGAGALAAVLVLGR